MTPSQIRYFGIKCPLPVQWKLTPGKTSVLETFARALIRSAIAMIKCSQISASLDIRVVAFNYRRVIRTMSNFPSQQRNVSQLHGIRGARTHQVASCIRILFKLSVEVTDVFWDITRTFREHDVVNGDHARGFDDDEVFRVDNAYRCFIVFPLIVDVGAIVSEKEIMVTRFVSAFKRACV